MTEDSEEEFSALQRENARLRDELAEARAVIDAIRGGHVDALVIAGSETAAELQPLGGSDVVYRKLFEQMGEGAFTLGAHGMILSANRQLGELLGVPLEKLIGSTAYTYLSAGDAQLFQSLLERVAEKGRSPRTELSLWAADGSAVPVQLSLTKVSDESLPENYAAIATDLRERKRNETLATNERFARAILEQASDAMVVCDRAGVVFRSNGSARRLVRGELVGSHFDECVGLRDEDGAPLALSALAPECRDRPATVSGSGAESERMLRVSVAAVYSEGAYEDAYVVTLNDVTDLKRAEEAARAAQRDIAEQLERAERGRRALLSVLEDQKATLAQVRWLANHDALTELPNQVYLDEAVARSVTAATQTNGRFALLKIDLDHFKNVNDTLGYDVGDGLLVETARRLGTEFGERATLARQGGDEFLVLLPEVDGPAAALTAQRLLAAIREPLPLQGHNLAISASVGIAVYPDDSAEPADLLRHADIAMYRAKELGRNGYSLFDQTMLDMTARRLRLDSDIRIAAEAGQLELYYQPQVSLTDGAISGLEALLRWNHPELGMVCPAEFIAIAENGGHIVHIGEWVIRTAAAQVVAWRKAGLTVPPVALNLSARQLRQSDFVARVEALLAEAGVEAEAFELELTESILLEERHVVIDTLNRLSDLGARLAIDDFGTGYSSLAYLKRLPMDRVKIDKSFVDDMLTNHDDAIIARTITTLGHSLGMSVIAEGVERGDQLDFLRMHHCDDIQGFIFSKPVPAEEARGLLEEGRTLQLLQGKGGHKGANTLLIVDDEPGVVNALRRVVRREGYHVITAASGEEALERLQLEDVNVIVSDQRMEGMSGIEFLSRAKELFPETVRIVLSGYTDLTTVTRAVNQGDIYRFLTKPWDDDVLRATLRDAFQRYALFDENRQLAQALRKSQRLLRRRGAAGAEDEGAG